jgi:hypothetical protein
VCVYLKANKLGSVIRAACIAKSRLYSSSNCLAYCKLDSIGKDCVHNRAYSKLA